MKWKYSVGLVFIIVLFILALSFGYHKEHEYVEEQADLMKEREALTVQGTAKKEQSFCLKSLNGYVVVYEEDGKTIYEYTDIKMSDLPSEIRQEIEQGKIINGLEKLYGFLENYSS